MAWINEYRRWLSESESLQNAQKIVDYLYTDDKDWSKESIAAMIGNMRHESSINPNMYEYGYDWSADRGFGLVQWTPRSKYWNWALQNGFSESELRNGDAQLARIDYEVDNNIQWIAVNRINNLTFKEFRTNSRGLTINQLTEAFTWGYERPNAQAGEESMPARKAFANRAYNELNWSSGGGSDPGDPGNNENIINQVINILNNGKIELENGININTGDLAENLMNGLKEIYNPPLFLNSKDFYTNTFFKITQTYKNMLKINPNIALEDLIDQIIQDSINAIQIETNIDAVFASMESQIRAIDSGGGGGDPGTENKPLFPTTPGLPITSGYGYRGDIGVPGASQYHWSIDIGGNGQEHPIYATQDGVVSFNGWYTNPGWLIRLEHTGDQYHSQYQHLAVQSPLPVGTTVKKGDVIGTMGTTGTSSGIHLDFAISINGTFYTGDDTIDPEEYLEMTF